MTASHAGRRGPGFLWPCFRKLHQLVMTLHVVRDAIEWSDLRAGNCVLHCCCNLLLGRPWRCFGVSRADGVSGHGVCGNETHRTQPECRGFWCGAGLICASRSFPKAPFLAACRCVSSCCISRWWVAGTGFLVQVDPRSSAHHGCLALGLRKCCGGSTNSQGWSAHPPRTGWLDRPGVRPRRHRWRDFSHSSARAVSLVRRQACRSGIGCVYFREFMLWDRRFHDAR